MKGELTQTVSLIQRIADRRKWKLNRVSAQVIKLVPPAHVSQEIYISIFLGQSDERVTRAYLMKPGGEALTATRIYGGVKGIAAAVRSVCTGEELKPRRKKDAK